jgi:FkbM family methyltransferase
MRALAAAGYELIPIRNEANDRLAQLIRKNEVATVLDVGANQGQYASRIRAAGFDGRMLSFEPGMKAFLMLKRNSRSDRRWSCYNVAIGRAETEAVLNVSANSVSSSILSLEAGHVAAAPESRKVAEDRVQVRTLDSILSPTNGYAPYWLKIDTQGYEQEVLLGATSVLEQTRLVQLEVSLRPLYVGQASYPEILELLSRSNFIVVDLIPGFRDHETGDLLQVDIIARSVRL